MSKTIEQRLQELEDREAIRQAICGYGYAVDGCQQGPAMLGRLKDIAQA